MASLFHTKPGSSKHQLRCEVNRLTAEVIGKVEEIKNLRAELDHLRFNLSARETELDAIRTGGILTRLRMILTGTEARLAKELTK